MEVTETLEIVNEKGDEAAPSHLPRRLVVDQLDCKPNKEKK